MGAHEHRWGRARVAFGCLVAAGAAALSASAVREATGAPPSFISESQGAQVRLALTTPTECNGNHAELYSVSAKDDLLRTVDPVSGLTLGEIPITLAGNTVEWANGLAVDPVTGDVYALLAIDGQVGTELVRLDVATGDATSIGDTGDVFAGIAFDLNGTLYGVTDDVGASPALYTISTTNATTELFLSLGAGDTGEAIAYNPIEGLIYHASGSVTRVFEAIDPNPSPSPITDIPLSGDPYSEAMALVSWRTGDRFLLAGTDLFLYGLTRDGIASVIGPIDHLASGLALIDADPPHALIEVHVRMEEVQTMGMNVVGAQFFLWYDNLKLQLLDVRPGGKLRNGQDDPANPFDFELAECSTVQELPPKVCETLGDDPAEGTIAYAVGAPPPLGTTEDMDLAVATFRSVGEVCVPTAQLVRFRTLDSGLPSHLLTDDQGDPVFVPTTVDLAAIRIDVTPPTATVQCPPDVEVSGACPVTATWQEPRFNDGNCVGFPVDGLVRTHVPDDGQNDPPPSEFVEGTSTVIYSAIDSCGNVTQCSFHVEVACNALVQILLDLAGPIVGASPGPPPELTRCIEFEIFPTDCNVDSIVIEQDVLFNMPADVTGHLRGIATLSVPAATLYSCITARDELHTLRQTVLLDPPSGTPPQYEALFIDDPNSIPKEFTDALRGGNINGDDWIDILDFGTWYSQYGQVYHSDGDGLPDGHTPCAGPLFTAWLGAFENIVGQGGIIAPNASNSDDGGDPGIPLGFTFNFFGDDHTSVGIASNGYLQFGTDLADFTNDAIPNPAAPNNLIAPYWDDWNPATAGDVYYRTDGAPGSRRFIAQWNGVTHFGTGGSATFQAVLFEGSNRIEFRYPAPLHVDSPTVGVENQDGSAGLPGGYGPQPDPVPDPGDLLVFSPSISVHSDIDGDGYVDNNDLYGHIQARFFQSSETDCCVGGPISAPPVRRISVFELRERGMEKLVVADLNVDGWLDLADVAWYYTLNPQQE